MAAPGDLHRRLRDAVMANARQQQPLCGILPDTKAELGGEFVLLRRNRERRAQAAAEARARARQTEAEALAGAAQAAEARLRELLSAEEAARREESAAAAARRAEAERREQEAAASAAAHRARMEALTGQIREIEARLGHTDPAVGPGEGVLEQLTALLDEQELLAAEWQRLAAEAEEEERRRLAAVERQEAETRECERQAREAEMARLAEEERQRARAAREAAFAKLYGAFQRIARSSLPPRAKQEAWVDLCRRLDLTDTPTPVELSWDADVGVVRRSHEFHNSLGMRFVPLVTSLDGKEKVRFSIWPTRVRDYVAYVGENPQVDGGWKTPGFPQEDTHPVVQVSWDDARGFCDWLTVKERREGRIGADQAYRLPTDSEWSWAVGIGEAEERTGQRRRPQEKSEGIKAGTHPWAFPWGPEWPPPRGAGNYAPTLGVDTFDKTAPVGSFPAHPQGFFDLGGNVWEWCADSWNGAPDRRVLRGGSWAVPDPGSQLSSYRGHFPVGMRYAGCGFRLVLVEASASVR